MATEVYAGPLGAIRTASEKGGGTPLDSTLSLIPLPRGTVWTSITPRKFDGADHVKLAFNPFLWVFKTTDSLATTANVTDGSHEVQDGLTTTSLSLSSLDTATNLDFVYVGSSLEIRGLFATPGVKSATASVLTIKYWTGAAWGTLAVGNGTSVGGVTFNQPGLITWTKPSDHKRDSLVNIQAVLAVADTSIIRAPASQAEPLFWYRLEVSAALSASTTLTGLLALNYNDTQYSEWLPGQTLEERIHSGPHGIGCIEALTDAGTASLIVNVAAGTGGFG